MEETIVSIFILLRTITVSDLESYWLCAGTSYYELCFSFLEIGSEINKLEEENKTLKRELGQTKKELEDTLGKLTMLNKNKKKMEKAIFKQIYETKHILQRARVNLEDGSSNENAAS